MLFWGCLGVVLWLSCGFDYNNCCLNNLRQADSIGPSVAISGGLSASAENVIKNLCVNTECQINFMWGETHRLQET